MIGESSGPWGNGQHKDGMGKVAVLPSSCTFGTTSPKPQPSTERDSPNGHPASHLCRCDRRVQSPTIQIAAEDFPLGHIQDLVAAKNRSTLAPGLMVTPPKLTVVPIVAL
jgi:hypothetical protein